jgi:hypothetical protein
MRKVFCCDLDATLVDTSNYEHFLWSKPRNWKAFYEGAKNAPSHSHIQILVKSLVVAGHKWLVATAREEIHREMSMKWIADPPRSFIGKFAPIGSYFRPKGDCRKDSIIKVEMLHKMRIDGYDPWLWIDDKERVVEALMAEGIKVIQARGYVGNRGEEHD